jgi:hypothetical protein
MLVPNAVRGADLLGRRAAGVPKQEIARLDREEG